MDEAITLILEGCQRAKFLEASLPNMTNQPEVLLGSCTEIIRVFSKARENISKAQEILHDEQQQPQIILEPIASGVQEWLKGSFTPAMDLLHAQLLGARSSSSLQIDAHGLLLGDAKMKGPAGGTLEEVVAGQKRSLGSGGGEIEANLEAGPSGSKGGSSSSQRRRKR